MFALPGRAEGKRQELSWEDIEKWIVRFIVLGGLLGFGYKYVKDAWEPEERSKRVATQTRNEEKIPAATDLSQIQMKPEIDGVRERSR